MQVKLVAVDLDGTVLRPSGRVSRATKRSLALAGRRGALLTVATGRAPAGARIFAAMLGATGPIICLDGALVFDGERALWERPVPRAVAIAAADVARSLGGGWIALTRHGRVHGGPSRRPPQAAWGQVLRQPVRAWRFWRTVRLERAEHSGRIPEEAVYKLLLWAPAGRPRAELARRVARLPVHVPSGPGSTMEVVAPGVNKGEALRLVCEHLGLDREHVVAFGDGLNDVEMLAYAGRGVAMGGAPAAVLAAATAHTEPVQCDGVARELHRLLRP